MQISNQDGFSLLEALIAASLIASVVVGLAHVITIASGQSVRARRAVVALTMAQSKLEYLRSLPWDSDASGLSISSPELAPSPPDALVQDSPPYVEQPAGSGFITRWAIAPAAFDPDTLIMRVCVLSAASPPTSLPDACVWTTRARRP
jgi:type II secretory pathway pseudopilin PulG